MAFRRTKDDAEIYFIGNLSNVNQTYSMNLEGTYRDLLKDTMITFDQDNIKLAPWEYHLVSKKSNE